MKTALLKFGGEVVADAARLRIVLTEVSRLIDAGWRFVLCHGGGPQANDLQARLGLEAHKVGGRRVTDDATLQVVKQVLGGEVSLDVTAGARAVGIRAVGISGVSDGVVTARRRPPLVVSGGGPAPVDFGLVGEIVQVRTELLAHLWAGGFTPVLNSLAVADPAEDPDCQIYNINADTVASAVAAALKVDHLFLMTGVPGVLADRHDPTTRIPELDHAAVTKAVAEGVIEGGMIPKVEEALENLSLGIGAVHILGAEPGALVGEAQAPGSRGTVLRA